MLIRKLLVFGLTLGIAICVIPARAHHSFAATFTDEVITVEGVVEKFRFTNPHMFVYFTVIDDNGEQQQWVGEGGSATIARSKDGWESDSLVKGDHIRITGNATHNGSPMISMNETSVINPNNGAIVNILGETPTEAVIANNSLSMVRADGLPNLTGAWTGAYGIPRPGESTFVRGERPAYPFNEVGAELQAKFDPINDPQVQCAPPGLVRFAGSTPHPFIIEQFDDHLIISYEEYGDVRTIYFDDRGLVGGVHSRKGQSVARYEGQKLIIETTHLLENLSDAKGNILSDQTTTVETYFRGEDENGRSFLNIEMAITDPDHLTATHTLRSKRPYTAGFEFIEADCQKPLANNRSH